MILLPVKLLGPAFVDDKSGVCHGLPQWAEDARKRDVFVRDTLRQTRLQQSFGPSAYDKVVIWNKAGVLLR